VEVEHLDAAGLVDAFNVGFPVGLSPLATGQFDSTLLAPTDQVLGEVRGLLSQQADCGTPNPCRIRRVHGSGWVDRQRSNLRFDPKNMTTA
jgi:hypothetical protein